MVAVLLVYAIRLETGLVAHLPNRGYFGSLIRSRLIRESLDRPCFRC
jgi:hypothetical protein